MQKYKINPAKTSYYFCEFETAMIFGKSEYLGVKESRIIPAQRDGYPSPKEAHDEYWGPSGACRTTTYSCRSVPII